MSNVSWLLFTAALSGLAWRFGANSARKSITDEVGKLREELRGEIRRTANAAPPAPNVQALPSRPAAVPEPVHAPAKPAVVQTKTELDPVLVSVISAAVAAFLGKQARIRNIRPAEAPLSAHPWAQAGRVSIQGSHILSRR